MELRIGGLNPRQCDLMDCIWSCADADEFHTWFGTLPYRLKQEVESLMELIHQEMLEAELDMNSLSEARAYIDNIRSWR